MFKYRVRKVNKPKRRLFSKALKSWVLWAFLLFLVAGGAGGYFFFFSSFLKVANINISGAGAADVNQLEGLVRSKVNENLFYVIPSNIFLASPEKLKNAIFSKFPVISQVLVEKNYFNGISISVEERSPAVSWCNPRFCFNVDKKGFAYEEGSDSFVKLRSDNEIKIGDILASSDFIKNIINASNLFKEVLDINPAEFFVANNERINVKTDDGWEIFLIPDNTISDQIQNLKLLLKNKIPPESQRNLEYIDLRFGNKIYVKYKSQSVNEINKD